MNYYLFVALIVACCEAVPVPQYQQGWSSYIISSDTNPAVVRIPMPDITFPFPGVKTLPKIDTVASGTPVITVSLPVPVIKTAAASLPVPLIKTAAALVPVVKTVATPAVATPVVVAAAPEPLLAPEPPMPSLNVPFEGGQFHSQDEAKQYSFGHWGGPNTRVEVKDFLNRVSGSFAYVNPDGEVHVRKYAAAPGMGFKVAASDLPEDTPAVAMVKAVLAQAHADAKASRQ